MFFDFMLNITVTIKRNKNTENIEMINYASYTLSSWSLEKAQNNDKPLDCIFNNSSLEKSCIRMEKIVLYMYCAHLQ